MTIYPELIIGVPLNNTLTSSYGVTNQVMLQAGVTYIFSLSSTTSSPDLVSKMFLFLEDEQQNLIDDRPGDIGTAGPAIEFTPTVSGLYYLNVNSPNYAATGPYVLSGVVKQPDAISSDIHTAGTIVAGGSVHGTFEVAGDTDWFKIHAEVGQHILFQQGDGSPVPISDYKLYNSSGQLLPYATLLEPTVSGDYFVAVSGNQVGDFDLVSQLVTDDYSANTSSPGHLAPGTQLSGKFDYSTDVDRFMLQVQQGQIYTIELTGDGNNQNGLRLKLQNENGDQISSAGSFPYVSTPVKLTFTATSSGAYSLLVGRSAGSYVMPNGYTIKASGATVDDYGDTPATAHTVNVGAPITGTISYSGDVDVFKIKLQAGVTYGLDLEATTPAFAGGTLTITDSSGAVLNQVATQGYTTWTPSSSGDYYMTLKGFSSGDYTLTPTLAGDDYTASPVRAGRLAVGGQANGVLETGGGDKDWFAIDLSAGTTYGIAVQATDHAAAPLFSNTQPVSLSIVDGQGQVLATTQTSHSNAQPVLSYTAAASGTYYVEVSALPGKSSGAYTLSASTVPHDDVGNTPAGAAALQVGVSTKGTLEVSSDVDVYKLHVDQGVTYAVRLDDAGVTGSPWARQLTITGDQVHSNDVRATSVGDNVFALYTAQASGDIYLSVYGTSGDAMVPYQLSATSLGTDDYGATNSSAGLLTVGGALHGTLNFADDVDRFKVTLQAGHAYQFDLQGMATGTGTLALYDASGQVLASAPYGTTYIGYQPIQDGDYYLQVATNAPISNTDLRDYTLAATALPAAPLLQGAQTGSPGLHSVIDGIVLNFNEGVHWTSQNVTLRDAAGNTFNANLLDTSSALNSRLVLSFPLLQAGTTYTLDIGSDALTDAAGRHFSGLHGYTFTTAPTVSSGGDGNDYLQGLNNGATLYGGAGTDTVIYNTGSSSFYTVTRHDNLAQVKYAFSPSADTLDHVERLIFADHSAYALDIDGVAGQAYRLYQAALDRQPDPAGLGYWIAVMDQGASLHQAASGFVSSQEFRNLYGAAPDDQTFATLLYNNVLHRAPDSAGLDYWLNVLHSGADRADVLAAFSESAENQAALVGTIGNGFAYQPYTL